MDERGSKKEGERREQTALTFFQRPTQVILTSRRTRPTDADQTKKKTKKSVCSIIYLLVQEAPPFLQINSTLQKHYKIKSD